MPIKPYISFAATMLLFTFMLHAQQAININGPNGVAISGYDAVAYFNAGKAVEGKKNISYQYEGVNWYFSSNENRDLFMKNPDKYAPAYGGWCAYAMATKGEKVEVNPETFKIVDGRLLLFYNRYFNNTLNSWNKDEKNLLPKADANWRKISH